MAKNDPDQSPKDPFDGEYVGNIWGKKMTIYGGAFILVMLGIVLYRHYALDVPFGMDEEQPTLERPYHQKKAEERAAKDTLGDRPGGD